jgi:hypothetical protein
VVRWRDAYPLLLRAIALHEPQSRLGPSPLALKRFPSVPRLGLIQYELKDMVQRNPAEKNADPMMRLRIIVPQGRI